MYLFIAGRYLNPTNTMIRVSTFVMRHCRRILVQWKDTFASVTFITILIRFVTTLLVYKNRNNGARFDYR